MYRRAITAFVPLGGVVFALVLLGACHPPTGSSLSLLATDSPSRATDDPRPSIPTPMTAFHIPDTLMPLPWAARFDIADICPGSISWLDRPDTPCITPDRTQIWTPRVHFEFDKGRIRPQSYKTLDRLAAFLQRYPHVRMRIEGHKDHIGEDHY